ncbi:MAG: transglycosylase domain-containing protein [Bacteroidales bacterium]
MKDKKKFTKKFYIRLFWLIIVLPICLLLIIFTLIGAEVFGPMPTFKELENPDNSLASQVISEDNKTLGKYYRQNRTYVEFKEISPKIVNALLATEDIRFNKHSGIDPRGLMRVTFKTILLGQSSGGGSTITQQLAKNLFPRDRAQYSSRFVYLMNLSINKFKEWVTAIKLERNYTKNEIIAMYLNTVPFGAQSYGIKSASQTFFSTEPDSLKTEEAATLIGLLKAPTKYSPILNPERSKQRRNIVLGQMNKYDFLTDHQFDSLSILPIELDLNLETHNKGMATYFREQLRTLLTKNKPQKINYLTYQSYWKDSIEWANNPLYGWCNKNQKPNGEPYDLYKDGLKIYTTINSKMQEYAEEAVKEHLGNDLQKEFFKEKEDISKAPFSKDLSENERDKIINRAVKETKRYYSLSNKGLDEDSIRAIFNKPVEMQVFSWDGLKDTVMSPLDSILHYKHFLRAGFMSMDPHNGHIKAYVGGPDYRYFKYDHVRQSQRQVGSTIKPFLYTLAMQEGYSPCHEVANVPSTFHINDTTWTPKNSGPSDKDGKMVTLKWGLTNSVNWISAWLIKQFNPQAVIDVMQKMGIESNIDPVPSIFLGTAEISLYEMVGAYSTYANKGVYIKPQFIDRIEDKNGNEISSFKPEEREAIGEQTAYLMLNLLQNVVDNGTAVRLRRKYDFESEIAGKTGTTQNQSDGWFMGVTPNLVSGAWVGGEHRSIHFDGIKLGQGANMALPIWALYMEKIYEDDTLKKKVSVSPDDEFEEPEGFNLILDCEEYENDDSERKGEDDDFF